ncbi:MAG: UvrB/UvrC motif-containing protein [Verrucomicrobia bacterium]|nr:UvrB/UvrC motif-containing protein [Verrucomicrobiota bacterium]
MLCNLCKENEATVHLTQIVGDKMQKVDLCEACSKEKGVSDPTGFSLADLLLGLGASQEIEKAAADGVELKCPACGFTQSDFKKSGRFGCPECYQTFSDGLEALLKTMHKGTKHAGKVPAALRVVREAKDKLKTLQKKLDKAIAEEDYEAAAQLRDELKHAKEKGGQVSTS